MDSNRIALNEINISDDTYRYHYPKYHAAPLRRSIREHGILTPCLLESTDAGYRIVHGFRRIAIAHEGKMESVPALISDNSSLEHLKGSLIDNRVQGEFNLYEQAKALEIAGKLGASESTIIEEFLPLVGLHAHKNVYDEYRGFLRIPLQLIDFFVEKDIAISRTQIFQKLTPEGQSVAVELLERFSPGINVLDEIITNLYEISRREEQAIADIYEELQVENILEDAGQPHLALGDIRQRLQKYRYPVLSQTNEEIKKLTSRLELGERVRIRWDNRLENRGLDVTFHWESVEDIKKSQSDLDDPENRAVFKSIFDKV